MGLRRLIILAALAGASLSTLAAPAASRERGGAGADSVREACREEARKAIRPGRTSRLDREQIKQLRREYRRDCRRKARAG